MNSLDIIIEQYFSVIRTQSLTEFMYLLTTIFDVSAYSILICLCISVLVYILKGKKYSILFLLTILIQAIVVLALKNFFDVSRPAGAVMDAFGKSFPSYHATVSTVFFVMLMYIFDSYFKPFGRILFNTFCIFMILLVASSRLYLGVHWLSDVVAGVALGVLISYLSIIIFKKINKK